MIQPQPPLSTADLVAFVHRARLDLSTEKQAQAALARAMTARGIDFEREYRIGAGYLDFLVGRIGIELKVHRCSGLIDQLERYAESPDIDALILASNRAVVLPSTIGGKPAYFASLGRGWL